jgi:NADH dehydrogenase [ubiquinone] 1 alpha subcomplex assembly factor 3
MGCGTRVAKRRFSGAYEGDGKTTVTIINDENQEAVIIDTYSSHGFRLSSGVFMIGPIAAFPRTVFQWDVSSVLDITEESLSLFWLLEPKIDVLVIGVGDHGLNIDHKLRLFLRKKGVSVEVLPTSQAVATFNFLNDDNRNVAAALIPPQTVSLLPEDQFDVLNARKQLYKDTGITSREFDDHTKYVDDEWDKQQKLFEIPKKPNK